jgi:hypothetical protein
MNEETNNMNDGDPEKKLPLPLDRQLRALLPEKELNNFREQLPEEFLVDASEGLDQVKDRSQLDAILKKLNQQLHQQLTHKKTKSGVTPIRNFNWAYGAVIIILILCICAYLVVRLLLHH